MPHNIDSIYEKCLESVNIWGQKADEWLPKTGEILSLGKKSSGCSWVQGFIILGVERQ